MRGSNIIIIIPSVARADTRKWDNLISTICTFTICLSERERLWHGVLLLLVMRRTLWPNACGAEYEVEANVAQEPSMRHRIILDHLAKRAHAAQTQFKTQIYLGVRRASCVRM